MKQYADAPLWVYEVWRVEGKERALMSQHLNRQGAQAVVQSRMWQRTVEQVGIRYEVVERQYKPVEDGE